MNELTDIEKSELALFFKRLCFDHVLDCTDGNNDKKQAYRILSAIGKLQNELAAQGYDLR
ncbi:MAG: hypothetical protein FWC06_08990 [Treponema sp.]|nr:hypothetical protein [Treponema sp.]